MSQKCHHKLKICEEEGGKDCFFFKVSHLVLRINIYIIFYFFGNCTIIYFASVNYVPGIYGLAKTKTFLVTNLYGDFCDFCDFCFVFW